MQKNIIFFDFDGVIADSFYDAYETHKLLCPDMTEADYRNRFNGNIWEDNKYGHSDNCRHDVDFFEHYNPRLKEKVRLFDGVSVAIKETAEIFKLVVISSSQTSGIQGFLRKHDLLKYFKEIMGADVHKSKSEKLKMILSKYGVAPEKCFFITDTLGDLEEASRVGVPTIGVTWGFHSKETLKDKRFVAVFSTPEELRGFFARQGIES